jgi:predicted nucleotidyltransferase
METQLIKPIVKIGNSAGVVLPKSWQGSKARIELIEESIEDITQKTLQILTKNNLLPITLGIYLIGSHARNEQTPDSDIDLLVITTNKNHRIVEGKYELTLIPKEQLKEQLKTNALPLLPWIIEAKPILNNNLLEEYKKTKLTYKNLKWHIETTKSAMSMNKAAIDLDKELEQKNTGDSTAYSLILRLRGIYIINCLIKNKLWKTQELIQQVKKISGSIIAYERYLHIKNDKGKSKDILPLSQAERLMEYIKKENLKQEKWLKEKRD